MIDFTSNFHIVECYDHLHFQGLKTGMYYLRSKPAANAIQFTVDQLALAKNKTDNSTTKNNKETSNEDEEKARAVQACRRDNPEACVMCSG